jgi:hypothetical protein
LAVQEYFAVQNTTAASTYNFAVTNVTAGEVLAVSFGARLSVNATGTAAPAAPAVSWIVGSSTQAMTKAVYASGSSSASDLNSYYNDSGVFYLTAPVTGNGQVRIAYADGNRSSIGFVGLRLSGVDTNNPIGVTNSKVLDAAAEPTSTFSLSLTPTATDSFLLSSLSRGAGASLVPLVDANGTQTILFNDGQNNQQLAVGWAKPGSTAAYALEWDKTGITAETRYAFTGVEFLAGTAPAEPTYADWATSYGLASESMLDESPAGDGIQNLMKYALGLNPTNFGWQGRFEKGQINLTGTNWFMLRYVRPEPAPADITYSVQVIGSLLLSNWVNGVEVSSTVSNSLRTITVRDPLPMSGNTNRFLRLKVIK